MKKTNEKGSKRKYALLKAILIILILLIIITLVGGYFYIKNEQRKIEEICLNAINNTSEAIEYGSKINYGSILEKFVISNEIPEDSTIEIEINDEALNPSEEYTFESIGNNVIKITVTNDKFAYLNQTITAEKEITFEVVDTKLPLISGIKDIEITEGDTLDLKASITAKDEIDGDLEVQIEGDFDPNKARYI